eukprot:scaffold54322_cov74-Phaeocystis_antarctica.AAC.9
MQAPRSPCIAPAAPSLAAVGLRAGHQVQVRPARGRQVQVFFAAIPRRAGPLHSVPASTQYSLKIHPFNPLRLYSSNPNLNRWGCETALQGVRMKLARVCLVSGDDDGGAPRGGPRPTSDPGDADHFAAAASPVLRSTPAGQRN